MVISSSSHEFLSFELRYWYSEGQKEQMQDTLASMKQACHRACEKISATIYVVMRII